MVSGDYIPPIRFSVDDVPELAEILDFTLDSWHEAERQRKEETVRRLEQHCSWQPFGDVW